MDIAGLHKIFKLSSGVSIDSRKDVKGKIFFALRGERFDGNVYVNEVLKAGARFVVTDSAAYDSTDNAWVVKDTLDTLQQLASFHRKKWTGKILAITGSNGKTTTKELVAAVLSKKYHVLSTSGNLNNHIGVPLTLLLLDDHEIAVIEMGANHQGEIKNLCMIANPDYGLITNIGKAHLEGFGGLNGVRKGKGELYDFLEKHKRIAFVYGDDPVLVSMASERVMDTFTYGSKKEHAVYGKYQSTTPVIMGAFTTDHKEEYMFASELYGSYNFANIMTAIAVGVYFDVIPELIVRAMNEFRTIANRSQLIKGDENSIMLDAYNANPTSMLHALKEFVNRDTSKRKLVILGEMLELGSKSHEEHEGILKFLADNKLKAILVGDAFCDFHDDERYPFKFFMTVDLLIDFLQIEKPKQHIILLKGSRKNMLEKATNCLL